MIVPLRKARVVLLELRVVEYKAAAKGNTRQDWQAEVGGRVILHGIWLEVPSVLYK